MDSPMFYRANFAWSADNLFFILVINVQIDECFPPTKWQNQLFQDSQTLLVQWLFSSVVR